MDYKKTIILLYFLLINTFTFAQPGVQGDLFIKINLKKYSINAYSIIKTDSNNYSELVKLSVHSYTQNKNIAVVKFADEHSMKSGFAKNIILVIRKRKKEMQILITGYLNPFRNYFLDINFCNKIYNIHLDNKKKIKKQGVGLNITPLLKEIE